VHLVSSNLSWIVFSFDCSTYLYWLFNPNPPTIVTDFLFYLLSLQEITQAKNDLRAKGVIVD